MHRSYQTHVFSRLFTANTLIKNSLFGLLLLLTYSSIGGVIFNYFCWSNAYYQIVKFGPVVSLRFLRNQVIQISLGAHVGTITDLSRFARLCCQSTWILSGPRSLVVFC